MSDSKETTPPNDAGTTFSARELKLMCAAFQCLKTPPECDYDAMAALLSYKNPRSVANAMTTLRKKMEATMGAPAGTILASTPKKKGPHAKKGKGGEDGEADVPETPKKTPRKRGKKVVEDVVESIEKDDDGVEDDEEEMASPTKKAKVQDGGVKLEEA